MIGRTPWFHFSLGPKLYKFFVLFSGPTDGSDQLGALANYSFPLDLNFLDFHGLFSPRGNQIYERMGTWVADRQRVEQCVGAALRWEGVSREA